MFRVSCRFASADKTQQAEERYSQVESCAHHVTPVDEMRVTACGLAAGCAHLSTGRAGVHPRVWVQSAAAVQDVTRCAAGERAATQYVAVPLVEIPFAAALLDATPEKAAMPAWLAPE